MGSRLPVIALTSGEPAGIGPELCTALAREALPARIVVIGDAELLRSRAGHTGLAILPYVNGTAPLTDGLEVEHIALASAAQPGVLNPANARYVLALIDRAVTGCLSGEFDAMVTAPVHKGVINDAGIAFTGHTEYLAEKTNTAQVVMLLTGGGLRVALASTHVALSEVAQHLTAAGLLATLRVLHADLQLRFGIVQPHILVTGLNPHAGESGHLGREEIDLIAPVVQQLRAEGLHIDGPLSADTVFVPANLAKADCVLAMYHDQGLPVLKYASFGQGVNVTLGLPIIRTSVDHGTALELAGRGKADAGSLIAAVRLAAELARKRTESW
jgi:4-hydroxythreonine-4-phosphate dehydrogenase